MLLLEIHPVNDVMMNLEFEDISTGFKPQLHHPNKEVYQNEQLNFFYHYNFTDRAARVDFTCDAPYLFCGSEQSRYNKI